MKKIVLAIVLILKTLTLSAENYRDMEPLKLEMPEMKAELVNTPATELQSISSPNLFQQEETAAVEKRGWKPDFDFFKSKTNPGTKPYKFMDDMTFVGIPLFVAGLAIKGDKAMFRVNNKDGNKNTQLLTDFKTGIDDYLQFFGPVVVVGLKMGGVEGRSDWPRLMSSSLMSYAIMAGLVNGIKYTAKEMRPDGSTANSWPSGHTATAFVGASILHKEYGLTRSPWYSVAGYGVAMATGVMRVLNNRHWISDVMSGAGIGIMSTELGYALCDLMFKGKGLLRNDLEEDTSNPSFFAISMGLGLGSKSIGFDYVLDMQDKELHGVDDNMVQTYAGALDIDINFRAATVVDAEGAYFFNKYIGVGGRFRVRAMSAKDFASFSDISSSDANYFWSDDTYGVASLYKSVGKTLTIADINNGGAPVTELKGVVKSDHLAEFTGSVGLYFNLPITDRFSVGTKVLIGRSITQELDIDGYATGNVKNIEYSATFANDAKGNISSSLTKLELPTSTGQTFTDEWNYLTLGAKSSTSWGTGISLTYRYKSNFSWRLFCDYDYTKKDFELTYDPYHFMQKAVTSGTYQLLATATDLSTATTPIVFKKTKKMNYWTLGLSFMVDL